ncbi:secreted RxLR effector protein 161-like [Ziziphus jujuba]|uniref:Secreted RxLR effector protein 161-like n=1 Tax=Ziziphus jujuba TaxID=326968 RepID=A0ABM3I8Y8_ZIZJJ|nr:secreted RxLR effector protein 161-like [Ziziphus jujuba]
MADCSISPTPASTGIQLNKIVSSAFKNVFMYRSTIGALQYLTITRPELTFIVNKLSQFMHKPTDMHWSSCKWVFRYLQGTKTFGLQIRPSSDITISGYIDMDWASNADDRRSTGSYCIFLGQNLVSWSSKKQHVVACSSTESEYRSLANGAAEVLWLQSLLNELQVELNRVPVIWYDNVEVGYLAENTVHHQRMKHIEIDAHFVRDRVIQKKLEFRYVPSFEQIADVLTKVLPSSQFLVLWCKLNLKASLFRLRRNDKIS